jgi:anaerobic magnesium-protoporphyrin IX monomethyl ester cyclase
VEHSGAQGADLSPDLAYDPGCRSFAMGAGWVVQPGLLSAICTYCQNKYLRELYEGKGRFVRYRSIENVMDEIKTVVSKYDCERVIFSDEMFTLNKQRIIEFCNTYQREVGLPFSCQARPTQVDEEILVALKEAGCEYVSMAIEAGNDHQRNAILKRNVSREVIVEAFSLAHKVGLKTGSFNMVGVPYETEATIWDTININRQVQPDLLMCTIFMPFKGTQLGERCEQEGWIKGDVKSAMDYYNHPTLELPTISSHKLVAYQMLFNLYVRLPKSSYWVINILRRCVEKIPIRPGFVPWLLKGISRRLIALLEKLVT